MQTSLGGANQGRLQVEVGARKRVFLMCYGAHQTNSSKGNEREKNEEEKWWCWIHKGEVAGLSLKGKRKKKKKKGA